MDDHSEFGECHLDPVFHKIQGDFSYLDRSCRDIRLKRIFVQEVLRRVEASVYVESGEESSSIDITGSGGSVVC
ncbi:12341_t:CDS:2 [Funneliformis geosporum]|nr:12341_t:CDS:2 [Funneliformis geosporum]